MKTRAKESIPAQAVVVTPDTTLRELARLLRRLEPETAPAAGVADWPYEPPPDADEDVPRD